MESATVGEVDTQLVSNASISRSVGGFMGEDLLRESLDLSCHLPRQPQREGAKSSSESGEQIHFTACFLAA